MTLFRGGPSWDWGEEKKKPKRFWLSKEGPGTQVIVKVLIVLPVTAKLQNQSCCTDKKGKATANDRKTARREGETREGLSWSTIVRESEVDPL